MTDAQESASDDRSRLRGLFEATLDVHRSMSGDRTRAAVLSSAGSLLRSSDVSLTDEPPSTGECTLAAPVELADRRLWLSVSGRSRTEPFDESDRVLLEALASVAAVALSNADLHAEVERQKDDLVLITRSLGEGVCAIDRAGAITYMNPAGASMLGWPDRGSDGWPDCGSDEGGPARATTETPRFLLDPALRAMSLAAERRV